MRLSRSLCIWVVPVIVVIVLIVLLQGCPINTGTNPAPPTLYSLEIDPGHITSYPGGGGLSRVTMTPGEDFPQQLRLSLEGDSLLGASLSDTVLTFQERVAEITLFPDTAITTGTYNLRLDVTHGDQINRFPLVVEVMNYNPDPQLAHAESKRDTFLIWLDANYPDYAVPDSLHWFGYNKNPESVDLYTWVFLSEDWEVGIRWQNLTSTPHWFLLRRRSEAEPVLAAKQAPDGEIRLVPVSFYGNWQ